MTSHEVDNAGAGESHPNGTDIHPALTRRFLTDCLWNLAGTASRAACVVITTRLLGKHRYGELGIVLMTATAVSTIAAVSLPLTAARYVSHLRLSGRHRVVPLLKVLLASAVVAGLPAGGVLFFLSTPIAENLLHMARLGPLVRIAGMLALLQVLSGLARGVLSGFKAFRQLAGVQAIVGLLGIPYALVLVSRYGVAGGVWAASLCEASVLLGGALVASAHLRREGTKVRSERWTSEAGRLWEFSVPMAISGAVIITATWLAMTYLARTAGGSSQVGAFFVPYRIREAALLVVSLIMSTALPFLSERVAANDRDGLRKLTSLNVWIVWLVTMPPAVFASTCGSEVLAVFGREFAADQRVLSICVINVVLAGHVAVYGFLYMAIGRRMWLGAGFSLFWTLILLVVSRFSVPAWGAAGLAFAFTVTHAVCTCITWLYFARRHEGVFTGRLCLRCLSVFALLEVLAGAASERFSGITALIPGVLLSGLCLAMMWGVADPETRKDAASLLSRLIPSGSRS